MKLYHECIVCVYRDHCSGEHPIEGACPYFDPKPPQGMSGAIPEAILEIELHETLGKELKGVHV